MRVSLRRCASLALVLSLTGCATLETGSDHVRDFAGRHLVVTAVGAAGPAIHECERQDAGQHFHTLELPHRSGA